MSKRSIGFLVSAIIMALTAIVVFSLANDQDPTPTIYSETPTSVSQVATRVATDTESTPELPANTVDLKAIFEAVIAEDIIYVSNPESFVETFLKSAQEDSEWLVFDEYNYFIQGFHEAEGNFTIAVFLQPEQGDPIVLVSVTSCGPICSQDIYEYYYLGEGKLVNNDESYQRLPFVTRQDIPALISAIQNPVIEEGDVRYNFLYELPRHGTTINIVEQYSGDTVGEIRWEKGKFTPGIYPPAIR
jgi:hypothetical protein